MKQWYLSALCVLVAFAAKAQQYDEDGTEFLVPCHTDEMHEALFAADPSLRLVHEQNSIQLKEELQAFREAGHQREGEPYIIPVVFHVVHSFGAENISNAQIADCIRVMNEDFTASGPTVSTVSAAFAGIVADVGVEFRLAKIDPQGNCTNGIVRTVSALTYEGGENLKQISPIWNRSKYMNVWVCGGIASGAAGYTFYPSTLAGAFGLTNDGIVVRHDYVGSIGTSTPQRSHVLTHEVGHWINLAHLWGSTNQPGVDSNCDTDDEVDDTPNTRGWTSCNVNGQSCGSLDNVENFMEYAYCMKMFTNGQKERMLVALNSTVASRSSLWQEQNLFDTGVLLPSAPCEAVFSASVRTVCAGESIAFQDESYNNISGRTWIFEGGEPALSFSSSPTVTYNVPGTYTVSLAVTDGNAVLTEVKPLYIRVLAAAENSVPYSEGFEDYFAFNTNIDDTWYAGEQHTGEGWKIASQVGYSGNRSAFVPGFTTPFGVASYLESRTFDLSQIEGNAALTFKYAHASRNADSDDVLRVWASRDCGESWSLRRTIQGNNLNSVEEFYPSVFVPQGQDEWRESVVTNIVSTFLTDEFRLRFEFISRDGNHVYIDDINLIPGIVLSTDQAQQAYGSFGVYPNPTTGTVNFTFDAIGNEGYTTIMLFDITGRQVAQLYGGMPGVGAQEVQVQLGEYPAGVYVASIRTEKGEQRAIRLLLQPNR